MNGLDMTATQGRTRIDNHISFSFHHYYVNSVTFYRFKIPNEMACSLNEGVTPINTRLGFSVTRTDYLLSIFSVNTPT